MSFLLYGANGYTGELVARRAVAQGIRPRLAGRNAEAVGALATELGLESSVFGLDDANLAERVRGQGAVLNCAGPFSHTAIPLARACIEARVHYLDVTGELPVFRDLVAQDEAAKAAGVVVLPGVGFDVVPSDCLALHLKQRLPTATELDLAIMASPQLSHGTATTGVEQMVQKAFLRKDGELQDVPFGRHHIVVDFGEGPLRVDLLSWGDLVTAQRSTGIANIRTFTRLDFGLRMLLPWLGMLHGLFARPSVQRMIKRLVRSGPRGPNQAQPPRWSSFAWGEVRDPQGARVSGRIRCPDMYRLTAMTSLAATMRCVQEPPTSGFQTPANAFGADFVLQFEGVSGFDVTTT